MKGLNRITVMGNLGKDPELRTTDGGLTIAKFSVAVSERVKKGDAYEDHTEWFNVALFGRTAEVAGDYLRKGRAVLVEGSLRTRAYEKDGETRYFTEVLGSNMVLLGSPEDGAKTEKAKVKLPKGGDYDDDLPF